MITAAGAGSGLDIESIVRQLMTLEAEPLQDMQQRRSQIDVQLSEHARLKSALSDLQQAAEKLGDPSEFGAFTATSDDEEVVQVETLDGIIQYSHDVEVTSLAAPHRLVSSAFADELASIGTGDYSFSSGDESFTVTLAAGEDSLVDLVSAINNSQDNNSIAASIVNVDDGSRVILTARSAGTANAITSPGIFTELNPAANAVFTIDGLTVTSDTNTNTTAVPGLSISLQGAGTAAIRSERDNESINELLTGFVDSYNELRSVMEDLSEDSVQASALNRRIESSIRQQFFSEITLDSGASASIFQLGLSFDDEGVLSVDSDTLNTAIGENALQVLQLFTDDENGFAATIEETLGGYADIGGTLDLRRDSLNTRRDSIDDQIFRFEDRLEQIEARYRRQFGEMDAVISQLQGNANYLIQSLGSNIQSQ